MLFIGSPKDLINSKYINKKIKRGIKMKVKCINDSWINKELTLDKEYEVCDEIGC